MSLERINVANTNSLFDDFKNLVINSNQNKRKIDVITSGEKVTEIKFHVAPQKGAATAQTADLRDTLRKAVGEVLTRSHNKFLVEAWGDNSKVKEVDEKMAELQKLVEAKLFDKTDEPLLVKDVKQIVVKVEALVNKLRNKKVADLTKLSSEDLRELVQKPSEDDSEKALNELKNSAEKAAPYLEMESRYTTEFNDKYNAKFNTGEYETAREKYIKNPNDKTLKTNYQEAAKALEKIKFDRFHAALQDENYCKAQLNRDHELITCSEHRVDEIHKFDNAVTESAKDRIKGFKGDTTAIFNKLVELAKAKGIKDPKILLRLFSDQRLFCGIMRSVSGTQEETVVRGIHPDVFAYMEAMGLCGRAKDGNYLYTTKANGAPKMDATEGTIVKAKVDFAGKELVDNPESAYLLFAAELSFATNSTNFDQGGALMHWLKCHENDSDMQSASEKFRDQRILNVGKLITRFFERQKNEWQPTAVANASPDNPKAPGYHDGEKNIGGLTFEQYKKAIKILVCSKDLLDIPGDKEMSKKDVNRAINKVLELAKVNDSGQHNKVEANYIETLHIMYRARMQAANDLGIKFYIGGPAGLGVFDNDPQTLRDIEMYEFLMSGGRNMTYVVPVYADCDVSEADDDQLTRAYIDSMERMLIKIKSDKDSYMKMMQNELIKGGADANEVAKLSYEELVKKTSELRAKEQMQARVQVQKTNSPGPAENQLNADAKDLQSLETQKMKENECVKMGNELLDSELNGFTNVEKSFLRDYLAKHPLDFFSGMQSANSTGMDILDLSSEQRKSIVKKVFGDLVSPLKDLKVDDGRAANTVFKPSKENGPKSANEVELNRVWRQSPGNNTCFMMSVVNGLAQTERGVALLKERFVNNGIKVDLNLETPATQATVKFDQKGDQATMFERTLHYGYKTFLERNGHKIEKFGEMGNVDDFGKILGLASGDAIMIGNEQRDDTFTAKLLAVKVLKALQEGKVCTLYRSRHYRTIVDAYLDKNGIPMFKILDSNQDNQVYSEPVSESMARRGAQNVDGTGGAIINIFTLPNEVSAEPQKNEAPKNEMPKNEAPVVSPTGGDNRMRNLSSFDSVLSAVDAGNLEDLLPVVNAFINQTLNAKPTYAFFRRYCEVVLELRHLPFRDDQNLGGRVDVLQGNVIRAELKALLEAMRSHEFMESFAANPGDFFRPDFDALDSKLKEMQNSRAKAEEEARKKAEEAERKKVEEEARKKVEEETKAKKLAQAQTNAVHAPNRQLLRLSDIELALRRAIGAAVPEMASHNMQAVMNARRFFSFRGLSHLAFDGSLNFGFVTRGREKVWSKAEEIAILNESLKLMEAVQSGYFQRFCGFRPSEHGDLQFAELGFVIHATLDAVKNRNDSTSEHNASEEDGLL